MLLLIGCAGPSGPRTPIGGIGKGSTKNYYCRGEWHYPQNYYEYDQTGLASWYGPGFHGKPKPYGEKFNMHGISAAHRTLPLPTVVKVTNLQNGKSINLVVDDRGPFVYEGRIIDLSVGAAKALGTYSKGLVTVRVQSIPSESQMLSNYLAKHGNQNGKMKDGRTWQQIYQEEIAGRYGSQGENYPSPIKNITKKKLEQTSKTAPTIDDLLDSVASPEQSITKSTSKKISPNRNIYINLGKAYIQKGNAQKAIASLPKNWNPSIQSVLHPNGQMLYNIKIGPFNNQLSRELLKKLQRKGFSQAIILED